jgi:putative redox protein
MEVSVRHLDNVRFEARARNFSLISDQPTVSGGTDTGMTPPELLLASLGTCAAYYAVEYLKARSISPAALEITASAEKATQPARLGSFRIDVTMPGLDARHEEGLLRAVHKCLIHNTLIGTPTVDIAMRNLTTA